MTAYNASEADDYDRAMYFVRAIHGGEWDAELALARELSESIEVDHDHDGPSAIGFKWDGLTYWFLIDETGCEWDTDDPRETMILSLLDQRRSARTQLDAARGEIERSREFAGTLQTSALDMLTEVRADRDRLAAEVERLTVILEARRRCANCFDEHIRFVIWRNARRRAGEDADVLVYAAELEAGRIPPSDLPEVP